MGTGHFAFYDGITFETLLIPSAPVWFYDHFLGFKLNKYVAADQSGALWHTMATPGATAPSLVANKHVVQVTLDVTDETEQQGLYWGDQLSLDLSKGLIFEFRFAFPILPTTGTEIARAVLGLASATNAILDNIATNAWLRIESGAQTVLLWETDDGDTDDNNNVCSGITLAANVYHICRIDATSILAVKFYIDGVLVGTADMSGLSSSESLVQPYFCAQKTKNSANTGTGTMHLDYVKIWQNES